MGRFLLPGPFFSTVALCGQAILDSGTEGQKAAFLTSIASGEMRMALALTEPGALYQADGISLLADRVGGGYVLNGAKMFVSDGLAADHFIVVARTSRGADPREGISLLLVDAKSPGITVNPLSVMGIDKQAEVAFQDVRVASDSLLGPAGGGWARGGEAPGLGQRGQVRRVGGRRSGGPRADCGVRKSSPCLWTAHRELPGHSAPLRQYARGRGYLSLSHVPGRVAGVERGVPRPEVSKAKAWTSDAYRRVTALAHQCHGAIAFTKEMDIHLYHKKAKVNELLFGDAAFHWERIAGAL